VYGFKKSVICFISLIGIILIFSIAYIYGPSVSDQSGNEGTETPNNIIIIAHETLTWTNSTIKMGNNITWINRDFAINHEIVSKSSDYAFDSGVSKMIKVLV
jgi:hypothetical protein